MFIRGTNYYYHLVFVGNEPRRYERTGTHDADDINLIGYTCHFDNAEFTRLRTNWECWFAGLPRGVYPEDRAFFATRASLYDPLIRSSAITLACSWTTCDEESLENYRDLTNIFAPRPACSTRTRPSSARPGRFGDATFITARYSGSLWIHEMTEPFRLRVGRHLLPNYETLRQVHAKRWPIRDHARRFFRRFANHGSLRDGGEPGEFESEEYIPRTQTYVRACSRSRSNAAAA